MPALAAREAIQAFENVTAIDPQFATLFYDKGLALGRLSKHKDAVAAFDMALSIDASDVPALYQKGLALFMQKRFEDAAVHLCPGT